MYFFSQLIKLWFNCDCLDTQKLSRPTVINFCMTACNNCKEKKIRIISILYIVATQPGVSNPTKISTKRVKDHGFKTAPDGRLIITDGNEKDSDTEKSKKKKTSFLQNDSEEDDYGKTSLQFIQNRVNDISCISRANCDIFRRGKR